MSAIDEKDDVKQIEEEEDEYSAIIIDNGGGWIKAGLASLYDDVPSCILPTVVGHSIVHDEAEYSDIYVGEEATLKGARKLSIRRPIKSGVVHNWEDMTTIWRHLFDKELQCMDDLEDSSVLLSETPLNPKPNREKTTQIMFETFNIQSFFTQNTATLELYAQGQTTGTVIGVGFDTCYTVPIYQGYALAHATNAMKFGGNNVNKYLEKLLRLEGFNLDCVENKFEVLEEIKKTKCYTATDYLAEKQSKDRPVWKNKNIMEYTLPDNNHITLGGNRFECAEIFFNPHLIGGHQSMKYESLCKAAYNSLLSVNIDVRKSIAFTCVMAGGGSMLNGFVNRFKKDLRELTPQSLRVNIWTKPNAQNSAYIGASVFSTLDIFKDSCITSEEYEENGPKIVNRKCF